MSMPSLRMLINRVTGVEVAGQGTPAGEALLAAGSAPYEEITRDGYAFHCISDTAAAGRVTLPTTQANVSLYNADPDGGRSLIIDAFFAIGIAAHTTLGQAGLIFVLGQTRVAKTAGDLVPRKLNGLGPGSDTNVVIGDSDVALDGVTGVAIGWTPIGPTEHNTIISLPGMVLWVPVDGRIMVSPGRLLGLNVWTDSVQNTFNCGVMWHEKKLTLG